jgi:hypothetical protein
MSEQPENALTATATATASTARMFRLPSPQVTLPIIAILGYTAFLVTGFGQSLGPSVQPLPIYTFLGLMLLALQAVISDNRTAARVIYVFLTSGLALVYAAFVYYGQAGNFARSPLFYFVVNAAALIVFIYDAIDRRRTNRQMLQGVIAKRGGTMPPSHPFSFGNFATDFSGLAILFYINYGLLRFLATVPVGHVFIQPINLDLSQIGISISNIPTLYQLNLVIAVGATAVALLLLGIVGVLAVGQGGGADSSGAAVSTFGGDIGRIANVAVNQVLLSLRLVLSPLVWLIPSFSIAVFADRFTQYLNASASQMNKSIWDLFNPFTQRAVGTYGNAFIQLGLGVIAVAAVILAVAVVEHDGEVIERTLQVLGIAGRTVALTLAIFIFSLAALNAFLLLINPNTSEPFQLGGATLIALVAGALFAGYATLSNRGQKPALPGA